MSPIILSAPPSPLPSPTAAIPAWPLYLILGIVVVLSVLVVVAQITDPNRGQRGPDSTVFRISHPLSKTRAAAKVPDSAPTNSADSTQSNENGDAEQDEPATHTPADDKTAGAPERTTDT